jgi:hypothetical protein
VIDGIVWDADENNVTRRQVEGIDVVIPAVTIGAVPDTAQPQASAGSGECGAIARAGEEQRGRAAGPEPRQPN